jgi:COP9 signalosome complex subunit 1
MGQEDLGTHLEQIGMLKEAADSYARMRHDASTTKHIMDCSQRLVSVALQRRDWTATMTNVGKITGLQNVDEEKAMQPYIKIVTGIGQLGLNKYREAALNFLQADGSIPANTFNDIASPNDVAIFGGLLALATMDRVELQERVLDNQRFRGFLEHEPTVRKAIAQFVSGRFAACLRLLEGMRPDCLLDIYFQRHVPTIYSRIRTKCIVGYFAPFSCVTLDSLDSSFGRPDELIEDELANMIRNGALNARIDSKAKVSCAA